MVNDTQALQQDTCLGRTCMKWSADGELTEIDFQLIMERLVSSDQNYRDVVEAEGLACHQLRPVNRTQLLPC